MQEKDYTLETILNAVFKISNHRVKKRFIFDQSGLGGIGVKWIIAFFISLPILLYIGLFNETVFSMLGIVQAIIFYIVFLSMVIILIVTIIFINNNKVIRQTSPSWQKIFPDVDFKLVLASGASPYKDFFQYYSEAIEKGFKGDALQEHLKKAFKKMQEENADLLSSIDKDRQ